MKLKAPLASINPLGSFRLCDIGCEAKSSSVIPSVAVCLVNKALALRADFATPKAINHPIKFKK